MTEEEFYTLSPEKQRVKLAEDVIKTIKESKLFIPRRAFTYLTPADGCFGEDLNQEFFQKWEQEEKGCYVCAIGAVVVTKILRYNQGGLPQDWTLTDMERQMKNIFSSHMLGMLEACFEGSTGYMLLSWERDACRKFYEDHCDLSPEDHLCAIMDNIIKNKGELVL